MPQHIYMMESILDKATQMMDALEKKISEYEAFQTEIQKLKAFTRVVSGRMIWPWMRQESSRIS